MEMYPESQEGNEPHCTTPENTGVRLQCLLLFPGLSTRPGSLASVSCCVQDSRPRVALWNFNSLESRIRKVWVFGSLLSHGIRVGRSPGTKAMCLGSI